MKEKIIKNLFLNVDYEKERTVSGIYTGKTKFYLIASLPLGLFLQNGKKEIASLKTKTEIKLGDSKLAKLIGLKAVDEKTTAKYRKEIDFMVMQLEKIINKVIENKRFLNKPIEKLAFMNF